MSKIEQGESNIEQGESSKGRGKTPKKENINIIFIGHVDSGKSTITGQILQQTGMLDERIVKKYKNSNNKTNFLQHGTDIFKESMNKK